LAVGIPGTDAVTPYPFAGDLFGPAPRLAPLAGIGSVEIIQGIACRLQQLRGHSLHPDRLAKVTLRKVK
jgi:hypothetical protein